MDETHVDQAGTVPADDQPSGLPRRRVIQLLGAAAVAPLASVTDRESAAAKHHRRKGHKDTHHTAARREVNADATTTLLRDDFIHGFDAASGTGNWFYFAGGPFVGNDGTATTSSHGLQVSSPVFHLTVPQDDGTNGLPGGFDHVKWLVYANRYTNGVPGFAAEVGRELSVEATISAQTFHTDQHPFGTAVTDPEDDLRLASAALNGIDLESWMVFDIFLTNTRIYAFYERLPFGRGAALGNYAAFSFQIPLADRRPGDEHHLSTVYDRGAGTVRWLVDGKERFRVDRLGYRIDRQYMTLDHGGDEGLVEPKQLDFGMGLFTLLDGRLPSGQALVKLSNAPGFYLDPANGTAPQTFADEQSLPGSRLFGQGAELRVERFVVQTRRATGHR